MIFLRKPQSRDQDGVMALYEASRTLSTMHGHLEADKRAVSSPSGERL